MTPPAFATVRPGMAPAIPGSDAPVSAGEWDAFVAAHPRATLYHTWRWTAFAGAVFGFDVHRLVLRDAAGRISGILPLVMQSSPLFGKRLVSMPFFNYGGPLGSSDEFETALISQAADLAARLRVRVLEIRDQVARDGFANRTDKVTVELALPSTDELLAKALGSKLRSQIRRADREEPETVTGGAELLGDFYPVFASTMRDLGTPVYPFHFFRRLFADTGQDASIVVIRLHGRPAAAAVLTHFRDRTEIPWAASLHELRATSVNMRLYRDCLTHAIAHGSKVFDFGRSTIDSGTHRFKLQWGGRTRPLHWVYPLEQAELAPGPPGGGFKEQAQRVWSKLPLGVANRLGPLISPGLPW